MAELGVAQDKSGLLCLFDRLFAIGQFWPRGDGSSRRKAVTNWAAYRVSIPNPKIAVTSTGSSPRNAGRNFQLCKATRIFEVVSGEPESRTFRSLRSPERSMVQTNTTWVGRSPSGRS